MIPEITRRSSTLGTPCDKGKYGSIRRTFASANQIRSLMTAPTQCSHGSVRGPLGNPLMVPEPSMSESASVLYISASSFAIIAVYSKCALAERAGFEDIARGWR